MALSSDNPIRQWWGTEILTHTADAIDMTYAKNGLPLLADHDPTRQVGWLRDFTLGDDGMTRATAVPGNHPDAAWVFQDMEDGIRPYMSIGFDPLEYTQVVDADGDGDGDETWSITRWMPMEASSVAIPADPSVGVGRSAERAATPVDPPARAAQPAKESTMTAAAVAEPVVRTGPTLDERNAELAEIANLAAQHGMFDQVGDWAKRGLSRDQVASEILTRQRETIKPTPKPAGDLDLTAREQKTYSLSRAILAAASKDWSKAGFEREASMAIQQRVGREAAGFFYPMASLTAAPSQRASQTGNTAGTNGDGGYSVQTTVMPMIELLRNRMLVKQLGAKVYTGLTDIAQFPRQITANTFAWQAENPSSGISPSKFTLDTVTLSPKIGMARTTFSRRLLVQSTLDLQGTVEQDLIEICAIGMDQAALAGTGSSNQPTGILNTSGITVTSLGTNGGAVTRTALLTNIQAIAVANADVGVQNWLFTPEVRTDLKTTAKIGSTYPVFLWADDNTVEGYNAYVTNQLPKTLTKGSTSGSCHAGVIGVWDQLLIGEFGGTVDLQVNPYIYEDQGMIATTAFLMMDVGCRHPLAFSAFLDITP